MPGISPLGYWTTDTDSDVEIVTVKNCGVKEKQTSEGECEHLFRDSPQIFIILQDVMRSTEFLNYKINIPYIEESCSLDLPQQSLESNRVYKRYLSDTDAISVSDSESSISTVCSFMTKRIKYKHKKKVAPLSNFNYKCTVIDPLNRRMLTRSRTKPQTVVEKEQPDAEDEALQMKLPILRIKKEKARVLGTSSTGNKKRRASKLFWTNATSKRVCKTQETDEPNVSISQATTVAQPEDEKCWNTITNTEAIVPEEVIPEIEEENCKSPVIEEVICKSPIIEAVKCDGPIIAEKKINIPNKVIAPAKRKVVDLETYIQEVKKRDAPNKLASTPLIGLTVDIIRKRGRGCKEPCCSDYVFQSPVVLKDDVNDAHFKPLRTQLIRPLAKPKKPRKNAKKVIQPTPFDEGVAVGSNENGLSLPNLLDPGLALPIRTPSDILIKAVPSYSAENIIEKPQTEVPVKRKRGRKKKVQPAPEPQKQSPAVLPKKKLGIIKVPLKSGNLHCHIPLSRIKRVPNIIHLSIPVGKPSGEKVKKVIAAENNVTVKKPIEQASVQSSTSGEPPKEAVPVMLRPEIIIAKTKTPIKENMARSTVESFETWFDVAFDAAFDASNYDDSFSTLKTEMIMGDNLDMSLKFPSNLSGQFFPYLQTSAITIDQEPHATYENLEQEESPLDLTMPKRCRLRSQSRPLDLSLRSSMNSREDLNSDNEKTQPLVRNSRKESVYKSPISYFPTPPNDSNTVVDMSVRKPLKTYSVVNHSSPSNSSSSHAPIVPAINGSSNGIAHNMSVPNRKSLQNFTITTRANAKPTVKSPSTQNSSVPTPPAKFILPKDTITKNILIRSDGENSRTIHIPRSSCYKFDRGDDQSDTEEDDKISLFATSPLSMNSDRMESWQEEAPLPKAKDTFKKVATTQRIELQTPLVSPVNGNGKEPTNGNIDFEMLLDDSQTNGSLTDYRKSNRTIGHQNAPPARFYHPESPKSMHNVRYDYPSQSPPQLPPQTRPVDGIESQQILFECLTQGQPMMPVQNQPSDEHCSNMPDQHFRFEGAHHNIRPVPELRPGDMYARQPSMQNQQNAHISGSLPFESEIQIRNHVRRIFGYQCFAFLHKECPNTNCKYSHTLIEPGRIFYLLKQQPSNVIQNAYKFILMSDKLFLYYFPTFCELNGHNQDVHALIIMIRHCEGINRPISYYKHVIDGLMLSSLTRTQAVAILLKNMTSKSLKAYDVVLDIILDSDVLAFLPTIEMLLKEPGFVFPLNHFNTLLEIAKHCRHPELIRIMLKGISDATNEYQVQLSAVKLTEFLQMVRDKASNDVCLSTPII